MSDSEFLDQLKQQAQTLRQEIDALKDINIDEMIDVAFQQVFGECHD